MRIGVAVFAATLAIAPASKAIELGPVETFTGTCEPSGVVPVSPGDIDGPFLVASDEDNILRLYSPGDPQPQLPRGADLNAHLGLDPDDDDDKVDFEGAAWIGDRIYLVGSHSRSGRGNRRTSRESFLSVELSAAGDGPVVVPSGATNLINELVQASEAIEAATALDDEKHEKLAPEKAGLNIEGLAAGQADGSAYLALRNPLSASGKAIMVPLGGIEPNKMPTVGHPILLDLGGRGVRSMEYSPQTGDFFVLAGPHQSKGAFDLYRWSGGSDDKPVPVAGAAQLFASVPDFHPEAMIVNTTGNAVRLFSDDGDLENATGEACQDLTNEAEQAFRSVVLTLD